MAKKKMSEPASFVKDEDIWNKAKKAVLPHADKYDTPYAVVTDVYKKMGGQIKKKKELAGAGDPQFGIKVNEGNKELAGAGDRQLGLKTNYWLWASEAPSQAPAPKQDPDQIPQEIQDEITKNPKINGPTLLNLIKAKGFMLVKKKVSEADSASSMPAVTRAGVNPKKKESAKLVFVNQKQSQSLPSDSNLTLQCRFLEGSKSDNGIGPTVFKVVLLQEGLGNFDDGFYYTRPALESGIPVFEGKHFFVDHPDAIEEKTRPERSTRDIGGWFENVQVIEADDGHAMLVGDLHVLPDNNYSWIRSLLTNSIDYSKKYPDKDLIGLSINASGPAQPIDIDDFMKQANIPDSAMPKLLKAKEKGVSTIRTVDQLKEAISCDLVTRAGAGGRVLEMLEKEKQMAKKEKKAVEAEEKKHEDGGADNHPDAAKDAELIKQMIKKHMDDGKDDADGDDDGDEAPAPKAAPKAEAEDEAGDHPEKPGDADVDMKHAHEAYEYLKKEGYEDEDAAKHAAMHMKMAKHMAAKHAEASKMTDKGPVCSEAMDDDGDADDKPAKKESFKQIQKLAGEVASLREALRKQETKEYLDTKLASCGLPRQVTKLFKESLGSPKDKAHVDTALKLFLEGYKSRSTTGSVSLFNIEKTAPSTETSKVSFAKCIKE